MKDFYIRYGMGGGYGGCGNWEKIEANDLEEAQGHAYEMACNDYECSQQSGQAYEEAVEVAEEEGMDEEETNAFICGFEREDMESWIDYEAQEEKPKDYEDEE